MEANIPHQVRVALKEILQRASGLTNDQAVSLFKLKYPNLVDNSTEYFHRIALVKILGEISGARNLSSVSDPDQGELFGGFSFPPIISVVVVRDDGKIERIRKNFLDATVNEAEAFCAPVTRKNNGNDPKEKTSQFVEFVKPFVPLGGTLREGLKAAKSQAH